MNRERYDGSGLSAALAEFSVLDAHGLQKIYGALTYLFHALQPQIDRPVVVRDVQLLKNQREWMDAYDAARLLGVNGARAERISRIVHDMRGGSLLALIGTMDLVEPATCTTEELFQLFCYCRDHLKIMRNGVSDIDPVRSAQDEEVRPHSVELLREKWASGRFAIEHEIKQVIFECDFTGATSNCCLEFSALDRIIYNLMNNAARYAAGEGIGFSVFVPANGEGQAVRFVIQNQLSTAQVVKLSEITSGDTSRLLLGGLSTSGSGLGMRICADFVTLAFGLSSAVDAVRGGYLGVRVIDDHFVTWFHWPRA